MDIHVEFDMRSGRILTAHHGGAGGDQARRRAQHHPQVPDEHIGTITVSADIVQPGQLYKVDVDRSLLVATDDGVGFSYGATGRSA